MALTPDTDQFSQFLRLAFLRSPNYVAGSSGWTINQDGSVEFNNGTFRGNIVGGALYIYTGAPGLGNPPQLAIVPSGVTQDPYGNAITSSKILMQANIITESAGIVRTAAAAPLIQLDGPHNAVLIYDAAAALKETIAPVATSDGLGNTVQAGFTSYGPVNSTYAQLIGAALQFFMSGFVLPPQVAFDSSADLILQSGTAAGGVTRCTATLAPGGPLTVTDGADGNNYATERMSLHITADQTINSTSPAIVGANSTPLNFPMAANRSYRFRAVIYWTQGATQAQQAFRLIGTGGLTLGNMRVSVLQIQQSTAGATVFQDVLAALNTDNAVVGASGFGAGANIVTTFEGVITPNVAGTLNLEARCVTSNLDTYTIRSWSFAEIMPE